MTRESLTKLIKSNYGASPEHPWFEYPDHEVFRHSDNQKWFALIMKVSAKTIGIAEDGMVDIVNLKAEPVLIGSLRGKPGFFPAYHMNKDKWITVLLGNETIDETLLMLLDMSFHETLSKTKKSIKA